MVLKKGDTRGVVLGAEMKKKEKRNHAQYVGRYQRIKASIANVILILMEFNLNNPGHKLNQGFPQQSLGERSSGSLPKLSMHNLSLT